METAPTRAFAPLPRWLQAVHWIIIVNFLLEIGYAGYIVFAVLVPEGGAPGPLYAAAQSIPHELMMTRRAYATECWIAIAGLSVYLGVTEILPRRLLT